MVINKLERKGLVRIFEWAGAREMLQKAIPVFGDNCGIHQSGITLERLLGFETKAKDNVVTKQAHSVPCSHAVGLQATF